VQSSSQIIQRRQTNNQTNTSVFTSRTRFLSPNHISVEALMCLESIASTWYGRLIITDHIPIRYYLQADVMPPAPGGGSLAQPTASDWRRLSDGAIVVTSFHPTYQPSLRRFCLSADEKLFAVIRDRDQVLHKLLPPLSTASQSYNLRERKHNY